MHYNLSMSLTHLGGSFKRSRLTVRSPAKRVRAEIPFAACRHARRMHAAVAPICIPKRALTTRGPMQVVLRLLRRRWRAMDQALPGPESGLCVLPLRFKVPWRQLVQVKVAVTLFHAVQVALRWQHRMGMMESAVLLSPALCCAWVLAGRIRSSGHVMGLPSWLHP